MLEERISCHGKVARIFLCHEKSILIQGEKAAIIVMESPMKRHDKRRDAAGTKCTTPEKIIRSTDVTQPGLDEIR